MQCIAHSFSRGRRRVKRWKEIYWPSFRCGFKGRHTSHCQSVHGGQQIHFAWDLESCKLYKTKVIFVICIHFKFIVKLKLNAIHLSRIGAPIVRLPANMTPAKLPLWPWEKIHIPTCHNYKLAAIKQGCTGNAVPHEQSKNDRLETQFRWS